MLYKFSSQYHTHSFTKSFISVVCFQMLRYQSDLSIIIIFCGYYLYNYYFLWYSVQRNIQTSLSCKVYMDPRKYYYLSKKNIWTEANVHEQDNTVCNDRIITQLYERRLIILNKKINKEKIDYYSKQIRESIRRHNKCFKRAKRQKSVRHS